ncbi:MAG: Lrp/AsnC family transcriptional regulator [Candidatus Thermoplasmatota archaeon]|nr:Lrp/AsnC family transcriptional regulator [Candidatus Thermoplasmatota archaeon]
MKLSKNEKVILWGLVKYPMLNDRQLSDKIKVRMSTLNAIKNKMKRNELIFDRIVPNVEIMDYEILTVSWTSLTRSVKDLNDLKFLKGVFGAHPNTYTAMIFGETLLVLSLYKNYTDFRKAEHRMIGELRGRQLIRDETLHTNLFPLSISQISKNFDYTAVIERAFGIKAQDENREGDDIDQEKARDKIHHLTRKEKTILKGILEAPDLPDNKIATMLDTTRQAVARHKKELLDLGVIKKTRVIDYGKLGFDILCLVEGHYNKIDNVYKGGPDVKRFHLPSFFAVYGNSETVSLSLFKDFDQFTEGKQIYLDAMKRFCDLHTDPFINLYSPKGTITLKHQEYLPLVEDFLKDH